MTKASTERDVLELQRIVAAPAERVFAMWTQPELLRQWMCPPDDTIEEVSADVRTGGTYRIVLRRPNGELWPVRGTYRDVRPPEHLTFTWVWEEDDPKDEIESVITIDLTERNGSTQMNFRQQGFRSEESRDSHVDGWSSIFARLDNAL
jgi:uncharacterized protein YndB with AHSA1/START domain